MQEEKEEEEEGAPIYTITHKNTVYKTERKQCVCVCVAELSDKRTGSSSQYISCRI